MLLSSEACLTQFFARGFCLKNFPQIECIYDLSIRAWLYFFAQPHFGIGKVRFLLSLQTIPFCSHNFRTGLQLVLLKIWRCNCDDGAKYCQTRKNHQERIDLQETAEEVHVFTLRGLDRI